MKEVSPACFEELHQQPNRAAGSGGAESGGCAEFHAGVLIRDKTERGRATRIRNETESARRLLDA